MSSRILVCGEALLDVFAGPDDAGRLPAELVVGGSPLNVAIGLARLGVRSAFFGGISTDRFGEILRDTMAREGVDIAHVRSRPQPTTLSVVATGLDGQPRYSFHGADAADRAIGIADLPADLSDFAAIAMGSYTLAVPPVADALAALAQREGARRVLSLDPNVRPTVLGDLAGWPDGFDRFARHATIVKASDEDIVTAFGGKYDLAQAAGRWRALGVHLVVVTRGGAGAVAFADGEPLEVPGRPVAVVDTVGAGDTVHAALLAGLDRRGMLAREAIGNLPRETLGELLADAVLASAITCQRRGADLPTWRAVEAARPVRRM